MFCKKLGLFIRSSACVVDGIRFTMGIRMTDSSESQFQLLFQSFFECVEKQLQSNFMKSISAVSQC